MESQRKLYKYILENTDKKKKNVTVEFSTQCKTEDCATEWNLSTSTDFGLFVILTCFFFTFSASLLFPSLQIRSESVPLSPICVVDHVNVLFEFVYCLVLQYTLITIFRLFNTALSGLRNCVKCLRGFN